MKLTEANKQVIKTIFNDYLNQYKAAGIAHNEAIQFAVHKTRQDAALMINTYFK